MLIDSFVLVVDGVKLICRRNVRNNPKDVGENSNDMDTYLSLTLAALRICQSSNVKVSTVDDARERSASDRKAEEEKVNFRGILVWFSRTVPAVSTTDHVFLH